MGAETRRANIQRTRNPHLSHFMERILPGAKNTSPASGKSRKHSLKHHQPTNLPSQHNILNHSLFIALGKRGCWQPLGRRISWTCQAAEVAISESDGESRSWGGALPLIGAVAPTELEETSFSFSPYFPHISPKSTVTFLGLGTGCCLPKLLSNFAGELLDTMSTWTAPYTEILKHGPPNMVLLVIAVAKMLYKSTWNPHS